MHNYAVQHLSNFPALWIAIAGLYLYIADQHREKKQFIGMWTYGLLGALIFIVAYIALPS